MNTLLTDKGFFESLAARICTPVADAERVTLFVKAESSDFIRFNRAAVRQATHVSQGQATLAVVQGSRRIESTLSLTGHLDIDHAALLAERTALLAQLADVPEDPYLLMPEAVDASSRHESGALPTPQALIAAATTAARGLDFVGFYAGGPVVRAFADSRGQRHWHHVESFHFDWCLYQQADKAVKTAYAGTHWDEAEFARRVATGAERLPLLALPPRALQPGAYRAYLTPTAMAELLGTLSWGGFGAQARRTGTSSLSRLEHRDVQLHAAITLSEDTARGIAPAFTAEGFAKPIGVSLIDAGRATGTLNSPRSARQYMLPANGANAQEAPESLRLEAGLLPESQVLARLDTGLYVSNLWYLNYSDRQACRMTGMTRFACFWVEDGRLVAPLPVMRFDDSFMRMFGDGLIGLTDSPELIPESGTYKERQLSSITTPGALVEGWRLTL
ncbi:metallopeptidase TldD-related protein [Piscinibacter sp. XHJ-5]|uniref:metallopeptidase TldD-related protein n=1 Tax=Piscinibacter sp. XHJ-5 TaxID=3037797 RepID=UPI002453626C|nr:metallopeptidase TldD-related protein [Piscinibacter sp. XHJ-5]